MVTNICNSSPLSTIIVMNCSTISTPNSPIQLPSKTQLKRKDRRGLTGSVFSSPVTFTFPLCLSSTQRTHIHHVLPPLAKMPQKWIERWRSAFSFCSRSFPATLFESIFWFESCLLGRQRLRRNERRTKDERKGKRKENESREICCFSLLSSISNSISCLLSENWQQTIFSMDVLSLFFVLSSSLHHFLSLVGLVWFDCVWSYHHLISSVDVIS